MTDLSESVRARPTVFIGCLSCHPSPPVPFVRLTQPSLHAILPVVTDNTSVAKVRSQEALVSCSAHHLPMLSRDLSRAKTPRPKPQNLPQNLSLLFLFS